MEFCVSVIIADWKQDVNLTLDIYLYALYILDSPRSRCIKVYRNLEYLKIFYTNTDSMFYVGGQEISFLNPCFK